MGWKARSGPAWHRSVGSALGLRDGTCSTMKTDAGKWAGIACTSVLSASTPPAEAPITMISCPDKASSKEDDYLYYRTLKVFTNVGRIQSTLHFDSQTDSQTHGYKRHRTDRDGEKRCAGK